MAPRLRIGTRGSPLALAQSVIVAQALAALEPGLAAPGAIATVVIKTTGDKVQDRTLADIGGKGLFTKEIDQAMLDNEIDLAVHSMKDLPTTLPDGIVIAAHMEREDPRDVLLLRQQLIGPADDGSGLSQLPHGARIGTASLRRQAQLLALRPDLKVEPMRGNVGTRLGKLERGEADATLLALAGLRRLGLAPAGMVLLPVSLMLPAVAQAAIGITARSDDPDSVALAHRLNHQPTAACVSAERGFLAALDGSCRTPIAGLAAFEPDGALSLTGLIAEPDGHQMRRGTWRAETSEPADLVGYTAFGFESGRVLALEAA